MYIDVIYQKDFFENKNTKSYSRKIFFCINVLYEYSFSLFLKVNKSNPFLLKNTKQQRSWFNCWNHIFHLGTNVSFIVVRG